jgi:hypothetical protein
MEILSKLPFDLQEYILVKIMKLYKLRQGKYIRQIDKNKYTFLEYVMRPPVDKNSRYYNYIHRQDRNGLFNHKFFIKNLYDRKESNVDGDIVDVRIEHKHNIYYYEIGIFRLKLKDESTAPNKIRKDIYHKGPLADNYYWDVFEFSYEVK